MQALGSGNEAIQPKVDNPKFIFENCLPGAFLDKVSNGIAVLVSKITAPTTSYFRKMSSISQVLRFFYCQSSFSMRWNGLAPYFTSPHCVTDLPDDETASGAGLHAGNASLIGFAVYSLFVFEFLCVKSKCTAVLG